MRHIVAEYSNLEGILTTRVVQVLRRVREWHRRLMENQQDSETKKVLPHLLSVHQWTSWKKYPG
jgi:hypothetical protein